MKKILSTLIFGLLCFNTFSDTFLNDLSIEEKTGIAIVPTYGETFYYLYNTDSNFLEEKILKKFEEQGYDTSNSLILSLNPNRSLTDSVKQLMKQNSCNVSMTLFEISISGLNILQVTMNFHDRNTGLYKTKVYAMTN